MKSVLFSGSAPSGILTIGNYIGALKQWKEYEREYDSIFCIVDLHALTVPRDPVELRERSLDFLCLYVACGLDPEESTIFLQSTNPHHVELCWILNAYVSFGELRRMTQFKDKATKQPSRRKSVPAGLLNYPILMAADILLYGTSLVPIGDDQRQHLELTRTIAQRCNNAFGEVFIIPEGFTPTVGGRIRNLIDPSRKMDKSDPNPATYVSLLDDPDTVAAKIMKAKTDSDGGYDVMQADGGIANLVQIMASLKGVSVTDIAGEYEGRGYVVFKRELAEVINETLKPIRSEYTQIRNDPERLRRLVETGKDKACCASETMMSRVKEVVGLVVR